MTLDHFMGWNDTPWGTILRTAPTPRSQRPLPERDKPGSGLSRADRSWMVKGLCRGSAAGLFYPPPSTSQREAKAVCQGCPVKQECLDYALATREPYGIWGGLNERERKRLLREQRAA